LTASPLNKVSHTRRNTCMWPLPLSRKPNALPSCPTASRNAAAAMKPMMTDSEM